AIGSNNALGTGALTLGTNSPAGAVRAFGGARTITNAVNLTQPMTVIGDQNLTFGGLVTQVAAGGVITTVQNNAATIDFAGGISLLAANTFTLTNSVVNSTTSVSGVITDGTGISNFTKAGTGTLTLSGANTYDGTTTVSAGILRVANNSAL